MKNNKTLLLAGATIGLIAIAWMTSHTGQSHNAPERMGEQLFKDVSIDDIATINMIANNTTSTITRTENGWVIPQKYNHPANFDRLHSSIVGLADVKIDQALTLSDKQKKDMHISADSPRIQFIDKNHKTMLEILLGDMRESHAQTRGPYGAMPNGRFISTDGGKSVVVVSETFFSFDNPTPKSWLNTELCSIPASDITAISITSPGQDAVDLKLDKDNKLIPDNPKPGENFDPAKLTSLKNALSYLNMDDVADPKLDDKTTGMDAPTSFEAKTKSGLLYVIRIGKQADDSGARYARISVTYAGAPTTSASKDNKDKQQSVDTLKNKARELNTKFAKWTYVIPAYKSKELLKKRADLLKDTPKTEKKDNSGATKSSVTLAQATNQPPKIALTPQPEAQPQTTTNSTTHTLPAEQDPADK